MPIVPPRTPSTGTGKLDALLTELGHPIAPELDEQRADFADEHEDLFEEIAAFARRGWAWWFDAETGCGYDPEAYEDLVQELLLPLGIQHVAFDHDQRRLTVGDHALSIAPPQQDDDWLDVGWVLDAVERAAAARGWQFVDIDSDDLHEGIFGVVPVAVWQVIVARGVAGRWRANVPSLPPSSLSN